MSRADSEKIRKRQRKEVIFILPKGSPFHLKPTHLGDFTRKGQRCVPLQIDGDVDDVPDSVSSSGSVIKEEPNSARASNSDQNQKLSSSSFSESPAHETQNEMIL